MRESYRWRGEVLPQGTYEGAGRQEVDEGGRTAATSKSLPTALVQPGGLNPKSAVLEQPTIQQEAGLPYDRTKHATPEPQRQVNSHRMSGLRQRRYSRPLGHRMPALNMRSKGGSEGNSPASVMFDGDSIDELITSVYN